MGCCLLGLLLAANHLLPQPADIPAPTEAATVSNGGSLASWRQSQQSLNKSQAAAVVYPDVPPLPPTAERLRWEGQMTFRKPDSGDDSANPALQARAEAPAAAEAIASPAPRAKSVAKVPSRPKTVARAERRNRPNYAAAYPAAPAAPFDGYRQAQFDRPAGGFFNFRMF
jgi:hypothetical protein